MLHRIQTALLTAGLFLCGGTLEAQALPGCLGTPPSEAYLQPLESFIIDSDSTSGAARDALGLVLGTAQDIQVVADTTVCRRAAEVFDSAHVAFLETTPQSRLVYVIRVQSVYFVIDPTSHAGHFSRGFVFNMDWRYRGAMHF